VPRLQFVPPEYDRFPVLNEHDVSNVSLPEGFVIMTGACRVNTEVRERFGATVDGPVGHLPRNVNNPVRGPLQHTRFSAFLFLKNHFPLSLQANIDLRRVPLLVVMSTVHVERPADPPRLHPADSAVHVSRHVSGRHPRTDCRSESPDPVRVRDRSPVPSDSAGVRYTVDCAASKVSRSRPDTGIRAGLSRFMTFSYAKS